MITIYYSTDNSEGHNAFFDIQSPTDDYVYFDKLETPYDIFIRKIEFEDNNSRVCLTTISNEVYCYYQNVYNLNLPQIKRIVIGKNTTDIPYNIIIPEIPNYSAFLSTEPEDDTGTGTAPQPKNNDESKDDTSSWNTLYVLVFFGIVIIIVVYVYVTLQKTKQSFKDSTFIYY